jgi:hypothetical protein
MAQNNQQTGQNPGQEQQIQVKVTDEVLKGVYANMVQIGHTREEFIMDFMNLFPPQGIINSRVIVSPSHMKRIIAALEENVKRYQEQFGDIPEGVNPQHNFGFRTE